MNRGQRIRAAREAKGWSLADLEGQTDVEARKIGYWETHNRMPRDRTELKRVVLALGLAPQSFGVLDENSTVRTIRIMGYAEADQAVHRITEPRSIENPPVSVPDGAECIILQDSALHPLYPIGAALFFWRWAVDPIPYLGRLCVIELVDGRIFVRVLERGSELGLWTLAGPGSAPVRDVRIKRAAPVDYSAAFPTEIMTFSGEPATSR